MLGIWGAYSQPYLLIFASATTLLFSLPLFLTPIKWAKAMRWTIPAHTHLAEYFGRCLGALALVITYLAASAAITGEGLVMVFYGIDGLLVLMVITHVYGAIKRIQPITETLEIGFWSLMLILNLCFHPGN
jgi:hypothetical protein